MSQSSVTAAFQGEFLRKAVNTCHLAAPRTAVTPHGEPQGSSGCEKHGILAQDSWDAHKRSEFGKPRLLHLPICRKALNSVIWDLWFSALVAQPVKNLPTMPETWVQSLGWEEHLEKRKVAHSSILAALMSLWHDDRKWEDGVGGRSHLTFECHNCKHLREQKG